MWLDLNCLCIGWCCYYPRKYGSVNKAACESFAYEAIWDLFVEVIMKFLPQSKNLSKKLDVGQKGNVEPHLVNGAPDD
jgi:hypothetical protein